MNVTSSESNAAGSQRPVRHRAQVCLHAWRRMSQRRISPADIEAVIDHGRRGHRHGALIYFVGRREVAWWRGRKVDLSGQEGIHVVVDRAGRVLTAWRNRSQTAVKH